MYLTISAEKVLILLSWSPNPVEILVAFENLVFHYFSYNILQLTCPEVYTGIHWYVYQYIPVHTSIYKYILVHTCMYQYVPVHTSIYWYVPVRTSTSLALAAFFCGRHDMVQGSTDHIMKCHDIVHTDRYRLILTCTDKRQVYRILREMALY